jgi:hypothetical protein
LKWGITFGKPYEIAERSARKVSYADRRELEDENHRRHAACEDMPTTWRQTRLYRAASCTRLFRNPNTKPRQNRKRLSAFD